MIWQEVKGQRIWLWIGVLFLTFYTGEACLFWGPNPRIAAPVLAHLLYWAAFGALLSGLIGWSARQERPKKWWNVVQSMVLGVAITAAVVGVPALIMIRTNDVTLGHAVLLFTLSLAAVVIGSLSFNPGWFLAGCLWASAGFAVLYFPRIQDYLLGAAVAIGFIIVGALRKSLVAARVPG
jgi:small-conductance mechanosensitive channel